MDKLKPEVKKLWLAALRSGEFQQTQQMLKSQQGYCCLGVLCELYRREVGGEWLPATRDKPDGEHTFRTVGQSLPSHGLPPSEVLHWAGLRLDQLVMYGEPSDDDEGYEPDNRYELVDLNDGTKNISAQPFSVIADIIEEQL